MESKFLICKEFISLAHRQNLLYYYCLLKSGNSDYYISSYCNEGHSSFVGTLICTFPIKPIELDCNCSISFYSFLHDYKPTQVKGEIGYEFKSLF